MSMRETPVQPAADYDAVVVGLGVTGLSCARWLSARGLRIAVTDSRETPPCLAALRRELPTVPVHAGGLDTALLARTGTVVVSPGIAVSDPRIAAALAGRDVIGDIELFARAVTAPVVAITGSNGKSTVTTLVGAMCTAAGRRVAVGGNLGTPALELLAGPPPELFVLELSSFQLETTTSLDAAAAVVLNLSADHLDRYDSMTGYAAAKQRIYHGTGKVVINLDDPIVRAMAGRGRECIGFSLERGCDAGVGLTDIDGQEWIIAFGQALMPTAETGLRGRHNIANALAAVALGYCIDLPAAAMVSALREFRGLAHRCQLIASLGGVDWINDSKATNVGAACAAIAGLDEYRSLVLIAGGVGKGAAYTALVDAARGRVGAAVLIGEEAAALAAAFEASVPVHQAGGLDEAVRLAAGLAGPGDAVLLSPACASFDQFDNYAHRGDCFAAAVRELSQ